jgi:hypothetical protein
MISAQYGSSLMSDTSTTAFVPRQDLLHAVEPALQIGGADAGNDGDRALAAEYVSLFGQDATGGRSSASCFDFARRPRS